MRSYPGKFSALSLSVVTGLFSIGFLGAQTQVQVTTSVGGPEGRPFATTSGAGLPEFHPSRVLVKFRKDRKSTRLNSSHT